MKQVSQAINNLQSFLMLFSKSATNGKSLKRTAIILELTATLRDISKITR